MNSDLILDSTPRKSLSHYTYHHVKIQKQRNN